MDNKIEIIIKAFNLLPIPVFIIKDKDNIIFINNAFTEITGYRADEINDYYLWMQRIFPDNDYRELIQNEWKEIIDKNLYNRNMIFKIKCKNNAYKYISFLPVILYNNTVLMLCNDVSQNIEREQTLIKSKEQFKKLMETTSVAILIYQNAKFVFVNSAACKLTGYSKDELIGMHVTDVVHPDYKELINQRAKEREKGIEVTKHYEFKIIDKNGNEKWIDFYADRFEYKNQPAILISAIDITHRKKIENKLMQSQKMDAIGHFVGGISHDFNNMLTPIVMSAEFILYNTPKESDLNIQAKNILEAAHRAKMVINKLLAFSKQQVLQLKPININKVIQDFSKLIKATINSNIEIIFNLNENIKDIKADKTSIEQIIMNLVLNAQDAMPEGGKIIIETNIIEIDQYYAKMNDEMGEGYYLLLSVSDTGIGMNKNILQNIFKPFFTTKEKGKGTGLGLSTVYGIVKQHNGIIHVYSEERHGTTFKIYFPIIDYKDTDKEKYIDYDFKNKTILIVDDEEDIVNSMIKLLEKYNFRIIHTINSQKAIEYVKFNNIDIIITDIVMPELNGIDMIKEIEKIKPDIKVLFMSGYSNEIVSRSDFQFNNNYISKPFSSKQLLKKLYDILS